KLLESAQCLTNSRFPAHPASISKEPGGDPALLLGLGCLFLLFPAPLLPEPLDPAGRVYQLLASSEVRVTNRANIQVDVLLRAAGLPLVAAGAMDRRCLVLRVY